MGLDIRIPIGLMFTVLGPILLATGAAYGTSLNTKTGAAMLCFGLAMLFFGWRAQRKS